MKTLTSKLITSCLIVSALLFTDCTQTESKNLEQSKPKVNAKYEIASDDYELLTEKALNHVSNFELVDWYEMMADDIEYYFPDGDAETRSKLIGKSEVMEFWNGYQEKSGNNKMTFTDYVHVPVNVKERLNYTGLTGVIVLSYFSSELVYGDKSTNIRMNFVTHFNDENLIDRYYTYYDRTPIIETVNANILKE